MIISNIKKMMKEKNVTIRQMMAGTGLSDKTILRARCEQINQCRLYTLETIAEFLGCKLKDLFEENTE